MQISTKGRSRALVLAVGLAALGATAVPSPAVADGAVVREVPADRAALPVAVSGPASPVPDESGASEATHAAAEPMIADEDGEAGVTWTFGAAAVLAGAAGTLRLARRLLVRR